MTGGEPLGERVSAGLPPDFTALLDVLAEAVTIRTREAGFVYANRAALQLFGFASIEEMCVLSPAEVLARRIVRTPEGELVDAAQLPSSRLMAGQTADPLLLHVVDRATGETRWELLKSSVLRDEQGVPTATVTMIENVTAVKAAEAHTHVLAESGRVLAASLDYQETLRNVARAAVPELADWCLVELVGDQHREEIVVAHVDPAMEALATRMRALEPAEPQSASAIARVVATGRTEHYREVTDEHLRRVAVSADQLELLRALEIRSAIVVPMRGPSAVLGTMSFFTSVSHRRLTEADVAVAEQLGRRAGVAVEHSRLHSRLTDVAQTLQRSLLPNPLPAVAGWDLAALYRPALAEQRIEVGGDFYEVFDAGPAPLALIGDVTGHGVAAATLTSLMRHGARFSGRLEPEPDAVLRHLDEELRLSPDFSLCTALCVRIHPRRLVMASAGHPPALHVSARGVVSERLSPGPVLGAFDDAQWPAESIDVADGELVLLYTDGVTETAGEHDRFGADRLRALLSAHAGETPEAVLGALDAELAAFRGGEPTDDVAALALAPR